MLGRFLERIGSFFSAEEQVIMPNEPSKKVKKEVKLRIVEADLKENFRELLEAHVVFIYIGNLTSKKDLRAYVEKLKFYASELGKKVYGLSPKWLFVTDFEIEKKS